jgi:uncharacterized delta-60 repeat protein
MPTDSSARAQTIAYRYRVGLLAMVIASCCCTVQMTLAADGDLDTTFGSDGFVLIDSLTNSPPIDTQAHVVAIDAAGRIVIAGSAQHLDNGGNYTDNDFLFLRLTNTGSVDTTFASDNTGFRLVNFGLMGIGGVGRDQPNDMIIQSNGSIVAAGCAYFTYSASHFALVRVDPSGNLDSSFGDGGTAHFGAADSSCANSVAIDLAGNIVLAGATTHNSGATTQYAAVSRLTPVGQIDTTFNFGVTEEFVYSGLPTTDAQDNYALALGLDGNGQILAAGGFDTSVTSGGAIVRLGVSGVPDSNFGGGVPVMVPAAGYGVRAIYVEPTGGMLVGGTGFANNQSVIYVDKILANGSPDANFGSNGFATVACNCGAVTLIAPTKRGGWLLAGPYEQQGVFIAKFLANGTPDTTLGGTGFSGTLFQPNTLFGTAKPALQQDGMLVVAGSLPEAASNGVANIGVMRILADYDTIFVAEFESEN